MVRRFTSPRLGVVSTFIKRAARSRGEERGRCNTIAPGAFNWWRTSSSPKLAAQAMCEGMAIVSNDEKLSALRAKRVW